MPKILDIKNQKFNRLTALSVSEGRTADGGKLWNFKCDCGNEKIISGSKVKSGGVKSCGCLISETSKESIKKIQGMRKLPKGVAALNSLYSAYRYGAKNRNLEFNLSKEQFKTLINLPCTYCGRPPETVLYQKQYNGILLYNGIDRKNNNLGYTTDNSTPCCSHCNIAKLKMDESEFLSWIKMVYEFNFGEK